MSKRACQWKKAKTTGIWWMKVRIPQHFLLCSVLVEDLEVTLCAYKKESSAENELVPVFQTCPSFSKTTVQGKILAVKFMFQACLWVFASVSDVTIFQYFLFRSQKLLWNCLLKYGKYLVFFKKGGKCISHKTIFYFTLLQFAWKHVRQIAKIPCFKAEIPRAAWARPWLGQPPFLQAKGEGEDLSSVRVSPCLKLSRCLPFSSLFSPVSSCVSSSFWPFLGEWPKITVRLKIIFSVKKWVSENKAFKQLGFVCNPK